jgi:hypothetical protein
MEELSGIIPDIDGIQGLHDPGRSVTYGIHLTRFVKIVGMP